MMNWYTEINVQNREIKTRGNQRFKDFSISAGVKKVLQRLLKLAVAQMRNCIPGPYGSYK